MTSHRSVVFAEPVRTAIGTFGGSLKDVPAPTLGAVAIGAAVAHAKLRPNEVETVTMGNVVQGGTKMNPARKLPSPPPRHPWWRLKNSGPPWTPARRILCDQHRRIVAL
jgi:Thiolase, N-terminal domain